MAYVYRHIRLDKNEPFYIGVGTDENTKNAYYRPKIRSDRNNIWKRIAKKTEYEIEILMEGLTREQAFEKEREFIKMYGRIDNKTGCLANMTDGGEGATCTIISESHRKAISEKAKERFKNPEYKANIVKNLDPLKKDKAHYDKHLGEKRKPVIQYTLDGETVKVWESMCEAERNGFNQAAISLCCHKKSKTHKGFKWEFYNKLNK
jgi:hypothetical protein